MIPLACAAPQAPPPELAQAYQRILPELAAIDGDIGYRPAGHPALRRSIAERYRQLGLPAGPGQIMVTNGGQQALSLLARLLVRPGDRVLTEAPAYPGAAQLAAADLLPRLGALRERRARQLQDQHDHLRAELAAHLPGWDGSPVRGGQTLWVRLPCGDGDSFAQTALRHGVAVLPGSGLDPSGRSRDHLRIHFQAQPGQLSEAVRRLAKAWQAYKPAP